MRRSAATLLPCIMLAGVGMLAPAPARAEHARLPERPVTLELRDAPLEDVLLLLAEQARLNLVLDDEVGGRVTLRLRNVPWRQAFDLVLRDHGLGHRIEGNVLIVAPKAKLLEQARRQAERREEEEVEGTPRVRIIPVSHARAGDLVPHVQSVLGDRGRVTHDPRTNSLIIVERAARAPPRDDDDD